LGHGRSVALRESGVAEELLEAQTSELSPPILADCTEPLGDECGTAVTFRFFAESA